MNDKNPVIELKNISFKKHLSESRYHHIDFKLSKREIVFFKLDTAEDVTTFGNLISGLNSPVEGKILFDGQDLSTLKQPLKETLRYYIKRVFAGKGLISNLTVAQNIKLSELHHTKRKEKDIHEEIIKLSEIFDIKDILNLRPFRCSIMHLKLAQWIRVLTGSCKLIILEEPFTKDPVKNQLLFDILNEKRVGGTGIIFLLHSMYKNQISQENNFEIKDLNLKTCT